MNRMKRQKDMTLKDELPRLIDAKNLTGENYRKNEEMEPKQKTKQNKNTQLWMWLAIEARFDAVKSNTVQEPEC